MRWIWIDKFTQFQSGVSARAVKAVTLAEEHLHDLYPDFPIVPHSLILEGMAQTAGILVGEAHQFQEKVILAKIGRATFHRLVRPAWPRIHRSWSGVSGTGDAPARGGANSLGGDRHGAHQHLRPWLERRAWDCRLRGEGQISLPGCNRASPPSRQPARLVEQQACALAGESPHVCGGRPGKSTRFQGRRHHGY